MGEPGPRWPAAAPTITVRALMLGERIDTAGLERRDTLSTAPLAFRVGEGAVVVFRYGVIVGLGLDPIAEEEVVRGLMSRIREPLAQREEETVHLSAREGEEEGIGPDGTLRIGPPSAEKLLLVADALAKSAALAEDERHITAVFDTVEPWAAELARSGRSRGGRRAMIRLIGQALMVQHRLAARVAAREKPDILWERPELERLYGRLQTEYELVERAETVGHKLDLIGESVTVMTDLIDTQRSLRLEAVVVALILTEIALTLFEMFVRGG